MDCFLIRTAFNEDRYQEITSEIAAVSAPS